MLRPSTGSGFWNSVLNEALLVVRLYPVLALMLIATAFASIVTPLQTLRLSFLPIILQPLALELRCHRNYQIFAGRISIGKPLSYNVRSSENRAWWLFGEDMKAKVFIVEDEHVVAEDLRSRLQSLSYDVVGVAHSSDEALLQIPTSSPSVVLMDLLLKGSISGVEAAKTIREEFGIPVIYVTALSRDQIEEAKIKDPCEYLPKPFTTQELLDCIQNALGHHSKNA